MYEELEILTGSAGASSSSSRGRLLLFFSSEPCCGTFSSHYRLCPNIAVGYLPRHEIVDPRRLHVTPTRCHVDSAMLAPAHMCAERSPVVGCTNLSSWTGIVRTLSAPSASGSRLSSRICASRKSASDESPNFWRTAVRVSSKDFSVRRA